MLVTPVADLLSSCSWYSGEDDHPIADNCFSDVWIVIILHDTGNALKNITKVWFRFVSTTLKRLAAPGSKGCLRFIPCLASILKAGRTQRQFWIAVKTSHQPWGGWTHWSRTKDICWLTAISKRWTLKTLNFKKCWMPRGNTKPKPQSQVTRNRPAWIVP